MIGIDADAVIDRFEARVKTINNIHTIKGDFLEIPIEKESLDCVLCYSVLHYIDSFEKQERFILKIADILKPGGRALIGDLPNESLKNDSVVVKNSLQLMRSIEKI